MAKAAEENKVEKIVEMIEGLTALELSDLAKTLGDKFDVAPMAAMPAGARSCWAVGDPGGLTNRFRGSEWAGLGGQCLQPCRGRSSNGSTGVWLSPS